ncbi:crossover junction endodeoxyribonuclease RuvC, partial [Cycloclasticus sp. 46_83_sub15_T18]
IEVFEYAARQIKQALVGKGSADKTQVQHMVKVLLKLKGTPQMDASDALGVALCHLHSQQTATRIAQ